MKGELLKLSGIKSGHTMQSGDGWIFYLCSSFVLGNGGLILS